jgi:hypothetical protein
MLLSGYKACEIILVHAFVLLSRTDSPPFELLVGCSFGSALVNLVIQRCFGYKAFRITQLRVAVLLNHPILCKLLGFYQKLILGFSSYS